MEAGKIVVMPVKINTTTSVLIQNDKLTKPDVHHLRSTNSQAIASHSLHMLPAICAVLYKRDDLPARIQHWEWTEKFFIFMKGVKPTYIFTEHYF